MESVENQSKLLIPSNIIATCAAIFPLIAVFFDRLLIRYDNNIIGQIFTILPTILCTIDYLLWKKEGVTVGNILWPILLYPVYIWKRSNILRQSQVFFWIWLASFIIFIMYLIFPIGDGQSTLERSACEITTQIFKEQLHKPISCRSVGILETEGNVHYAIAELSNNNTIDISITEMSGGRIYVEIAE
ncbi:hypothetical protein [Cardiobacterium valvarum]|uniref:Uncharacterized protein n=2 Tax=Cardiobacterium valvarum TaxID=194702 RepID=A0A381DWQ9_9GAMM|nr:hypothetical protein [Cardiobacterium valvarum]EHM53897.1 hypothetical protein HMPREF9080_01556 [Cardiobacterium valvarum F0432]SUX17585.1 Uncharacterised protein [Cardiobacterium valvarum]